MRTVERETNAQLLHRIALQVAPLLGELARRCDDLVRRYSPSWLRLPQRVLFRRLFQLTRAERVNHSPTHRGKRFETSI